MGFSDLVGSIVSTAAEHPHQNRGEVPLSPGCVCVDDQKIDGYADSFLVTLTNHSLQRADKNFVLDSQAGILAVYFTSDALVSDSYTCRH